MRARPSRLLGPDKLNGQYNLVGLGKQIVAVGIGPSERVGLGLLSDEFVAMRMVREDELLLNVVDAPDWSFMDGSFKSNMFCTVSKSIHHRLDFRAIFINGHLSDLDGTEFVIKIDSLSILVIMKLFFEMIPPSFCITRPTFSSSPLSSAGNTNSTKQEVIRNSVIFHDSIWGDQFLEYVEKVNVATEKQLIEELKEEVRKELMIRASNEASQDIKLIQLIDVVQRLGLAYHFEKEIEESLQHIYVTYGDKWINYNNIESLSLWFRLLRQHGFNVSSAPSEGLTSSVLLSYIFENHGDEKGNFQESICDDPQGMLALYEAAYMRVEGEEVLDKALEFTKIHLGIISKDPSCDSSLRTEIEQALKQPLRKRLPRLEAVRYIPIYQQKASHNEVLLKLAKLDFNVLQEMHKDELSQICKWWKDLDTRNKLPFVRDRLIESYFWVLGVYFEPQHSRTRIFLVKTCMWLIVLDDTYDNYGTYEELEIFTQAVERWSISCLDELPEYMKLIYEEQLSLHQEMEKLLEKEEKTYQIHYIKEMAKEYTRSLLLEAKWLKEGYMPTLEEYMSNSLVTGGYALMTARTYVARDDDVVTEDAFKWLATHPPLVKATCTILRLMDDIATHKEEQERVHIASSIECYRKETGASEEEACKFFLKQVEDAWKVMNRESLRPTNVPFPLVIPAINLARVIDTLYKDNDGYNHADKEVVSYITSLFVHPMIV
ncbi:(E)-beta-farnesene synthase-like protein [Tanacetum coccineum]